MLRTILLVAIILLYTGLYFFYPKGMDVEFISMNLLLVFFLLMLFLTKKEKNIYLKKQYLKHSYLFILGYVIVHFQYYLDFALGNTTNNNTHVWYNIEYSNVSIILSVLGLASFLLGYLVMFNKKVKVKKSVSFSASTIFFKVIALASLVVFFVTMNPLYFAGMYGRVEVSPITTYAEFAFQIAVFAIVIQNSVNIITEKKQNISVKKYLKRQGLFINSLIAIYLIGVILSGDRGPIMYIGLCYVINFIYVTKAKIKLKYILLSIIIGAFFITILGQVRLMDKEMSFEDRFFIALSGEYVNPNRELELSISPSTKELATSIKTVQISTALVPDRYDYFYGRFQLQYILATIPFGTEFKNLLFDDNSYQTLNSGKFITWHVLGANNTYELGTSCVADLYLDLSFLGVIIGMLLFGIFLRYCEILLYSNSDNISLLPFVLCIVYLAFGIYVARSMLLFNLKFAVYLYILLYINKILFSKRVN